MAQTQNIQNGQDGEYLVLARKYRPQNFSHLIGQDMLAQTLKNALDKGRLAHAFILTGVRGVGKTTTARIIAKGLNCIGPDGNGQPTLEPCGVCENCKAITEDRHMDVIEMDAASRTGVDNVREIIDSVKYQPVSARYKIYIIDEVHMLSTAAFNALLKTLEEPPAHVKFIFATTEIRKVPVTVLSRCQRFDLRRIHANELKAHFKNISDQENVKISDEALALIARAADGSARDGLSLLDQAISLSDGAIDEGQIRVMLGLADRSASLDLLQAIFEGDAQKSIDILQSLYNHGADPIVIVEDLLEAIHWLSRLKMTPDNINREDSPGLDYERSVALAQNISVGLTSYMWQMLLKGLNEVKFAPSPLMAAEMLILRLITASNLPSPEEAAGIIKKLAAHPELAQKKNQLKPPSNLKQSPPVQPANYAPPVSEPKTKPVTTEAEAKPQLPQSPKNIEELIDLLRGQSQIAMASEISHDWSVQNFANGHIIIAPIKTAKRDFPRRLSGFLSDIFKTDWRVEVMNKQPEQVQSYSQHKQEQYQNEKEQWQHSDAMQKVKLLFPEAQLLDVKKVEKKPAELIDLLDEENEEE
ncbi:MAG: DNA polymerase III subunit gamma/tau [Alphaproteobacteria bacterium]